MLLPGAIVELKIYQNVFAAEASPQTSLRDTALHGLPTAASGYSGGSFAAREGRGVEEMGGERERGKKGKSRGWKGTGAFHFHHFFFYNFITDCP